MHDFCNHDWIDCDCSFFNCGIGEYVVTNKQRFRINCRLFWYSVVDLFKSSILVVWFGLAVIYDWMRGVK
jgi:hypothetical protein